MTRRTVMVTVDLRLTIVKTYKTKKAAATKRAPRVGADFFKLFWEESWTYIKTVVDVLREPVILLDKNLTVLAANEAFYALFQVKPQETEGKVVYELGNGQWNIVALRQLLEDILPKETFFKGFEVDHEFPFIGHKTIILNARHIHSLDLTASELFPPIIMLAMEDVTSIMSIAKNLARHTNNLEQALAGRTLKLERKLNTIEKELKKLNEN